MHTLKILSGDFVKEGFATVKTKEILIQSKFGWWKERIPLTEVKSAEVVSEEAAKGLGYGAVGLLLIGPFAGLAGLALGGIGKQVMLHIEFNDGRRLLASGPASAFARIQVALFERDRGST